MIQLPTRRARWVGSEGSSILQARPGTGRTGVHRRSFSFACHPTPRPQRPSARAIPTGTRERMARLRVRIVPVRQCPAGDPLTERPAETAAAEAGRTPIDVEDLHKLVLQSLDDDQALGVVSIPLAGKSNI